MIKMAIILLLGLILRIYGVNWDQGFHLHPDERMLIMVAGRINFFKNLNPDFFNYGSLPIYLIKGTSQLIDLIFKTNLSNYQGMLITGRALSIIFDLVTTCLIYKIGQLLFKKSKISLLSSFLYAVAFFPIQNSHFFVVDVFLNTFTTLLIYLLLKFLIVTTRVRPHQSCHQLIIYSALIGIIFAAMIATKFTVIILLPVIISIIFIKLFKHWRKLFFYLIIFHLSFVIFNFFFMPYAYLNFQKFFSDISLQLKMNSDAYIFPYTLQYVGTLPYLYYLKNIFLWGLGPVISVLSIIGLWLMPKRKNILFFIFYLFYFLIIGRSAVKFMRYMLPLYPFFALLSGYGLYQLYKRYKLLTYVLITGLLLWTFMFLSIYSITHTRIAASDWIIKNIPKGSTLAVEHWDDRVPLYDGEKYNYQELTLYDQPDDETKWQILNEKLSKADYIIIASNRLYAPLQKLSNCQKFKSCYPATTEYYKKLFNNQLLFKKVAEFTAYPELKILNFKFQIKDDSADESFTVYDHPKIMIFKNNE